jgi:hypothetical protein
MKRTKTTEIIIETEEIFCLRDGGSGNAARDLNRQHDAARVHPAEIHEGDWLICADSPLQEAEGKRSDPAMLLNPAPRER